MIVVATVLGFRFSPLREVNPAYVLVLVGLAGIAVKQSATPAVA